MGNEQERAPTTYRVGDSWRAEVLARVAVVRGMADAASAGSDARMAAVCARVHLLLDEAELHADGVRKPRLRWLQDWRNGGSIERAWRNLHAAEILLAEIVDLDQLASQLPAVRSMAQRVLACKDARRLAIEQRLTDKRWEAESAKADGSGERRLRREYIAALTWVNDACDKNFTRVRSFRNIVLATSVGLVVVAVALGIIGAVSPQSLPLCFAPDDVASVCPTGTDQGPSGGDAPLVLGIGLTAGAFAAALSVRGIRGTSTPYGVPVAIAWLKLPAGALTALFGMLMVHGQFVPGLSALDTQGQIIAYAIVLGYAQQVFTRLIDSQAHAVLDKAPSSEPTLAPGDAVGAGAMTLADLR